MACENINLYSNVPAVLSEIVANAWDADAHNVTITIDKVEDTITIEDDGVGMNRDAVIDRFLTVGFKRRDVLGETTPGGRKPMGRKGIGKLSIFSIAQIAEVYTTEGKERTAFKMDRDVIRKASSDVCREGTIYGSFGLAMFPQDAQTADEVYASRVPLFPKTPKVAAAKRLEGFAEMLTIARFLARPEGQA